MSPDTGPAPPGLREVFAVSDYRRRWTARTISEWGDTFDFVALALLVYDGGVLLLAAVGAGLLAVARD